MKAFCEIIVERAAFEAALSTLEPCGRRALRDPHWCMLLPHASGLQMETAWLTATLAGDGQWSWPVRVAASLLLPLVDKLGTAPSLRLLYVSERLFIDGLSVAATDMGMFRPTFTSGPRMRTAVQRQLFRPEALVGKISSRFIQAPPSLLPLFHTGANEAHGGGVREP